MVSILAVEAGEKIGADTQLIRTGALYHDIGKMDSPAYFTENQNRFNPKQSDLIQNISIYFSEYIKFVTVERMKTEQAYFNRLVAVTKDEQMAT